MGHGGTQLSVFVQPKYIVYGNMASDRLTELCTKPPTIWCSGFFVLLIIYNYQNLVVWIRQVKKAKLR